MLEVCKNVEVERPLIKLRGEEQQLNATAKLQDNVRLDTRAKRFWIKSQKAFFDVRVFKPNAKSHLRQTLKQCCAINENEKRNITTIKELWKLTKEIVRLEGLNSLFL